MEIVGKLEPNVFPQSRTDKELGDLLTKFSNDRIISCAISLPRVIFPRYGK